jgi:Domain of unknown function (DUF4352)
MKNSKKILVASLAVSSLVFGGLTGCSSPQASNTTHAVVADTNNTASSSASKVAPVNENGFKFSVTKIENVTSTIPYANQGTAYAAATIDMDNTTKDPISISVMSFRMVDQDNKTYQIDANTFGASNALKDGYVNPGQHITGVIIFAVPSSSKTLSVQYSANDNPYDENSFFTVPYVGSNGVK